MTKILIVEDEVGLITLLKYNLEKQGYTVLSVSDGKEVIGTIELEKPDFIILDWMLPNVSGIDLCREIRKEFTFKNVPILMLTARSDESDKVKGLSFGADDYMTKPFSVPELMARIAALLRRVQPNLEEIKTFGHLMIDVDQRRVMRGKKEIHLGPTEFKLLQCLMERPGAVLSREALLKMVWGQTVFVELRTVDVHIKRLRTALNAGQKTDMIRTVRSAGYALSIPNMNDN